MIVDPKGLVSNAGSQNLEDLEIEDLYTKFKVRYSDSVGRNPTKEIEMSSVLDITYLQKLQRMLEFIEVQEEYIKDEQRNLKKEYLHAQEEVKRIQSVPLVIGQFLEAVDQNTGIGILLDSKRRVAVYLLV